MPPKILKSAAEIVKDAIKAVEAERKASEALGKVEGKTLMVTESDRTKVGQGYLGGPGFSSLQLTDPAYRDVGAVWGVAAPGKATTILNASRRVPEGQHVFTTMVGSPTQHRSNQQVFNKLLDEFRASAREGNLSDELRGRINDSLRSAINKEGNPIFAPNVDIMSPKFRKQANTFERRAVAADLIAGEGIGGKKGQIIDFDKVMRRTTDPMLLDVPTGSMGPRLFTLSGETIQRPDLHPAFPSILTGEDLGVAFQPAPIELMLRDYVKNLMETKGRKPGYMDITRGHGPKQFISEDLLTEMQKAGYAKGGSIDLEAEYRMASGELKAAGGGFVRKAMKAIQKAADSADVKMTPATKDLTTMQDTHTNLMDSVRDRAAQMRKVMEGFEYKYKPGEHVFTESKSKKPLPPWKIVDRQLSGNMVMREPVPPGTPALMGKIVRDPETGKPLRTPYEPGYKVRREYGADDWEETVIPESGILGRLDPDEPYAKGGLIKSLVKAIGKELPEAKASQKTQIPGTEPTYRKAYDILEREKPGGRTLDYGAGLGHGSRLMGAESFEPFPREGFSPTFIRPEDIPTEEFDRLVNLNVLNVMPRDMRDATVENIGRVMRPGGMGIVTTRGRDVLNAAGEAGPEPMSKITSIGTYQKGFSPEELREYLTYILGKDYDISRLNLGPAGAMVRKKGKAEGGAVLMKRGGKAKGETLASMDTGKVEMGRAPGAEKAEKILSGAAEFIPGVAAGKSALEGEYQKALIEAGLDFAGGPIAKGLGAAIPAVAGIFIGPKSKLWDKTAAKEFAKLEKAGASPQEAWQQTGTFRSPDGILRQEISDQPSRLRRERMMDLEEEHQSIRAKGNEEHKRLLDAVDRGEMTKEAAEAEWERIRKPLLDQRAQIASEEYPAASKLARPGQLIRRQNPNLSQTLYHPELFKAYPQLKHIRTEYKVDPSARPRGHLTVGEPLPWSSSNAPSMFSVAPTTPEARNIILHEAQHGIQRLENMGVGGNPNREWGMLPSEMHPVDYVQRLEQSREGLLGQLDDLAKQAPEGGWDLKSGEMHPRLIRSGALTRRIENTEDAIRAAKQGEYHPLYQRMAGEAEARAVQKRMTYGPEYRREMFPLDEYDVPIDQLVVRTEPYAKGGPVKMADGGDPTTLREMGQPRYSTERKGPPGMARFTKDVLENLYQMAKVQAAEELQTNDPRAITDVANNIIADTVGAPVDMVNMALQSFGVGSERPIGGSQQLRDLMREYEMTSGVERPLTETLLSIAGPGAVAKGPRAAEQVLNLGTAAVRRPFTPATLTVEATAPDLGQGTSYGFRQGLNDRLLRQLSAGRKAREGQGVFSSDITNTLETNPMLAIDVPRAGKIGEGRGSNEALRREIAQAGIDLNQESMGAHRFIPLLTNRPEDASAILIKSKGGLSNEEVIKLSERLGNDMVVAHNPRLGGVVIYPYGPVGKGGAPEFVVAKKTAEEILGKKGKIQYGVADYDKDRLYMQRSLGDYQRAGAQPMSAEQADLRQKLQGLEKFMFTDDPKGVPGNIQGAPLGGLQPWSRGKAYPTHIQGIGDDWRAINYLTEETGARRPTLQQAEEDRAALLDKWHRVLPGKVR